MNPQEQNKAKSSYQNQPASPAAGQKADVSKSSPAANTQQGAQDKNRKEADGSNKTDKDACGTK